ncbi:hypothetical protein E2C01_020096 [Portunus trituberculatus]|uniref:Uncharacterized protein n=1 Tax=Portunus trituberculatus TaxID=210409 RepID=A0A5B7E282_PORTR|nr:hypothetical protein [Portunus trituberculatus]
MASLRQVPSRRDDGGRNGRRIQNNTTKLPSSGASDHPVSRSEREINQGCNLAILSPPDGLNSSQHRHGAMGLEEGRWKDDTPIPSGPDMITDSRVG